MLWIMSLAAAALALAVAADPPVYITLWFDTEDYITPADDEACLRLAKDLTARGVQATFKIVGEKARVLEQRKRRDAIAAMRRHDIAYHSDNHSIPPTPAVYLRKLGMAELRGRRAARRPRQPAVLVRRLVLGVQSRA